MNAVDPIPPEEMLGESDWEDQDLLTIDDAQIRIQHELDLCHASLASHTLAKEQADAVQARVQALQRCLASLSRGATSLAAVDRV